MSAPHLMRVVNNEGSHSSALVPACAGVRSVSPTTGGSADGSPSVKQPGVAPASAPQACFATIPNQRLTDSVKPLVAKDFFEAYMTALLNMVTSQDWESSHAAWAAFLHQDFRSVAPSGAVVCSRDEVVTREWRQNLQQGCYSAPCVSKWRVEEHSPTCVDCSGVLERHYKAKGLFAREVLHFRATALRRCEDGQLRVLVQFYSPAPPCEVRGVRSRSQIGQDMWVASRLGNVSSGVFLDVGANHSEELSNTFFLEKALNWSGVCVEPFPQGDWSTRSAHLVQSAVGPDGGKLRFVAPGHVLGGLVDQVNLPRVQLQVPAEQQRIVEVTTQSLPSILREGFSKSDELPKVIHYLSLDTEGSEYDILCQFPFETCTLLALTVEHNFLEPARTKIRELLQEKGFAVDVSVEHDDFYILNGYEKYL